MYVLLLIVLAALILYSLYHKPTATHTTAVEEHDKRYWFVHMFNECHGLPDIPYTNERPKHVLGLSYFGWDSLAKFYHVVNARSHDVAKVIVPKTHIPKPVFHQPEPESLEEYYERKACRKRNYNRPDLRCVKLYSDIEDEWTCIRLERRARRSSNWKESNIRRQRQWR